MRRHGASGIRAMQHHLRIVIILVGALCVFAPAKQSFAQTKKRIAVLEIEDAPSATLGKDIVGTLRGRHTVISSKTFNKAAHRLDAELMTSENLALVASEIGADGILSGSVTESGGRYVLRLHLRSGRTGKTVQKLRLRLSRARLSKRMRAQLRRQLDVAIKQLRPVEERGGPDEDFGSDEEIEVVVGPKARAGDDKKDGKNGTSGGTSGTSGDGDDDAGDDDDDGSERVATATGDGSDGSNGSAGGATGVSTTIREPDEPRTPMPEARRAASIMVGASVVMRDLTFNLAEDFDEAPNGYNGPTAPGLNVRGEFYPLQLTGLADSVLSIVGVGFQYDRVLGLQTAIDANGQEILAGTAQSSYSVGARLRYRFASIPTRPSIIMAAGIGKLMFVVDDSELPAGLALDVPNTTYSYFDPGLWVRVEVHPRVHVQAGGQLLLITDAGQVQEPEQYGGASITSYAADASVEVLITPNWRVRAAGTYTYVGLAFLGNGEQTFLRDGDPGDIDVLGADDSYMGGVLSLGYVY